MQVGLERGFDTAWYIEIIAFLGGHMKHTLWI